MVPKWGSISGRTKSFTFGRDAQDKFISGFVPGGWHILNRLRRLRVAYPSRFCFVLACCSLPAGKQGRRVGVLNLPQGVALVTTWSVQTPPASKFVLGFPGFHRHHGNSFGLGTFSSALAPVRCFEAAPRHNPR